MNRKEFMNEVERLSIQVYLYQGDEAIEDYSRFKAHDLVPAKFDDFDYDDKGTRKNIVIEFPVSWGDYGGTTTDRSNYEVISEALSVVPLFSLEKRTGFYVWYSGHNGHSCFVVPWVLDTKYLDEALDFLTRVNYGEVLDEEHLSNLEQEIVEEDWEYWIKGEVEEVIEAIATEDFVGKWVDNDELYNAWFETFNKGEGEVIFENAVSCFIQDVEGITAKFVGDAFKLHDEFDHFTLVGIKSEGIEQKRDIKTVNKVMEILDRLNINNWSDLKDLEEKLDILNEVGCDDSDELKAYTASSQGVYQEYDNLYRDERELLVARFPHLQKELELMVR